MKKINSIWIVDDDPITVFGIKKILGSLAVCDYISTYKNGKVAIDSIKQILEDCKDIPDIIFLDINMPIMDGWQFMEEFVSLPVKKKVRINIVTSSIDPLDWKKSEMYKSKTHHVVEFNTKPIRKKDLEEITIAA